MTKSQKKLYMFGVLDFGFILGFDIWILDLSGLYFPGALFT